MRDQSQTSVAIRVVRTLGQSGFRPVRESGVETVVAHYLIGHENNQTRTHHPTLPFHPLSDPAVTDPSRSLTFRTDVDERNITERRRVL